MNRETSKRNRFLSGFGALMALRNATRDDRVRLRLLNPAPPVERLLDILHAERVFEIIPSRPCSQ